MITGLIETTHPLSPEESVGFAEVVAYIQPETLRQPLASDVAQIYLYCNTQLMKQHNIAVPEDIAVDELRDYELQKLNELKRWLYKKRGGKIKNPVVNALNAVFKEAKQPKK